MILCFRKNFNFKRNRNRLRSNKKVFLYQLLANSNKTIVFFTLIFSLIKSQAQGIIFTQQTESAGIEHRYLGQGLMGSGVAIFDANKDLLEDIFLTSGLGQDRLYINNGDGTFRNATEESGIRKPSSVISMGVVTGDLNNDGYREILVTTFEAGCLLYANNGDGTFTDITETSGIQLVGSGEKEDQQSFSATLGDVNLDGLLDIYVVNWIDEQGYLYDDDGNLSGFSHRGGKNRLFLNRGNLKFQEVGQAYGVADSGTSLAATFSDFDQDRDLDLLVANDFGQWVRPNALYRNDYPQPGFSDISEESGFNAAIYGMGMGVADYDHDGDLDYYSTNIGRNVLLQNQGNRTFRDVTTEAGVEDAFIYDQPPLLSVGWGNGFPDLDLDTYPDLVVATGRVGSPVLFPSTDSMADKAYRNLGDGTFEDISIESNFLHYGLSRGLAYGDYDMDGDVDIIITHVQHVRLGIQANPVLFRNDQQTGNHWLKIKLEGTRNNRDAMGAQLEIHVDGSSWIHEISSGGQAYNSQHSSIAHLGLGKATALDSLIVRWPGKLSPDQVFYQIPADQFILIQEGQTGYQPLLQNSGVNNQVGAIRNFSFTPNPANNYLLIEWEQTTASSVRIELFNQVGQRMVLLADETFRQGIHHQQWSIPQGVTSGLYFLNVVSDKERHVKKVVIQK
jgi:hypothetical protein